MLCDKTALSVVTEEFNHVTFVTKETLHSDRYAGLLCHGGKGMGYPLPNKLTRCAFN